MLTLQCFSCSVFLQNQKSGLQHLPSTVEEIARKNFAVDCNMQMCKYQ